MHQAVPVATVGQDAALTRTDNVRPVPVWIPA